MATRRDSPYLWATWLPRLLTGESACEWAVWFRTHYQDWDRVPSGFDQTEWLLRHTALLNEVRDDWRAQGYRVAAEDQNAFHLRGSSAILAGKPDLIARKGRETVVIDVKTGRDRPSHAVQVKIYQYAVPLALNQYRERKITGLVVYEDHVLDVPPLVEDDPFVDAMTRLIRRLASNRPATLVPSRAECRFCEITDKDCPDRVNADSQPEEGTTEDF